MKKIFFSISAFIIVIAIGFFQNYKSPNSRLPSAEKVKRITPVILYNWDTSKSEEGDNVIIHLLTPEVLAIVEKSGYGLNQLLFQEDAAKTNANGQLPKDLTNMKGDY